MIALRLLRGWKDSATEPGLRRLWWKPRVRDESGETFLLQSVAEEAGRALAAIHGLSFAAFLRDAIRSGSPREREAAMSVAGSSKEMTIRDDLVATLHHPAPAMRGAAIEALGQYEPEARLSDPLWRVFQEERDVSLRRRAMYCLGGEATRSQFIGRRGQTIDQSEHHIELRLVRDRRRGEVDVHRP